VSEQRVLVDIDIDIHLQFVVRCAGTVRPAIACRSVAALYLGLDPLPHEVSGVEARLSPPVSCSRSHKLSGKARRPEDRRQLRREFMRDEVSALMHAARGRSHMKINIS
jgi:hypothetical protein